MPQRDRIFYRKNAVPFPLTLSVIVYRFTVLSCDTYKLNLMVYAVFRRSRDVNAVEGRCVADGSRWAGEQEEQRGQ